MSAPLLDRIDLHIEVPAVRYAELAGEQAVESSRSIRERVVAARKIQLNRFSGRKDVYTNAQMHTRDIRAHCALDAAGKELMEGAMTRLGLSARAYDRILKVSRTIADLTCSDRILSEHVSEAIQYRSLDRGPVV